MGDSSEYMRNADVYRKDTPELSDNDIKSFNINRGVWFNSTIAVCVVYGVVAIAMLLIVMFSSSGSQFITDDFRAFSLTFIGGLIFVIILLIVQIMSFKPKVYLKAPFDGEMCPDYWTLIKNPDPKLKGADRAIKQYYCEPPSDYTPHANVTKSFPETPDPKSTTPVTDMLYNLYGTKGATSTDGKIPFTLDCKTVYPSHLSSLNNKNAKALKDQPNALQCAYAQQCGVPWTSMCPTVPSTPM